MIESRYWREELRRDIRWLREKRTYRRWSEKQMVLFERRLILVAFQVRMLIEQQRVCDEAAASTLPCRRFEKRGPKPVTLLNRSDIIENFDLEEPLDVTLSAWDLSNQLIHHYVIFAMSGRPREFTSVWFFSDYKRNECLFEADAKLLIDFLAQFADDSSARTSGRWVWNPKRQDYDLAVT